MSANRITPKTIEDLHNINDSEFLNLIFDLNVKVADAELYREAAMAYGRRVAKIRDFVESFRTLDLTGES